jgi:hypothetical protein
MKPSRYRWKSSLAPRANRRDLRPICTELTSVLMRRFRRCRHRNVWTFVGLRKRNEEQGARASNPPAAESNPPKSGLLMVEWIPIAWYTVSSTYCQQTGKVPPRENTTAHARTSIKRLHRDDSRRTYCSKCRDRGRRRDAVADLRQRRREPRTLREKGKRVAEIADELGIDRKRVKHIAWSVADLGSDRGLVPILSFESCRSQFSTDGAIIFSSRMRPATG